MTTIDNNNYDILGKVDSIDLLTHLNKVEQFKDRDDLQDLKGDLNFHLLKVKLKELKNSLDKVENFTNSDEHDIKLLKDLFKKEVIALPPPLHQTLSTSAQPQETPREPQPNTPIVVKGTVLTEAQKKQFEEINDKLKDINEPQIDLNNLYKITPKNKRLITFGENPIWMGIIKQSELGREFESEDKDGANVFMKDDGWFVVDHKPFNPFVNGENATIKKDDKDNYVLLADSDKKNSYGFEFEYKGVGNTLGALFGLIDTKGGKKKSKSKRTKKNASLKKRK